MKYLSWITEILSTNTILLLSIIITLVTTNIETTDGHPFWVVTESPDLQRAAREVVDENGVILYHENLAPGLNGFWVEAKDLRVGDVFLGANGELSTLTNIVRIDQSGGIAVFNFSVEGNHNYFVLAKEYGFGQSCVLVHNAKYKGKFECDYDLDYPRLHADIPDHVPSNWGPVQIEKAIDELEGSIANRIADMANYDIADIGHINRLNNEITFLNKCKKVLVDLGGGWQ